MDDFIIQNELFFLPLLVVAILLTSWVLSALYNYKNIIKIVDSYREREITLLEKERAQTNSALQAQVFMERMELKDTYPEIAELSDMIQKDEKAIKKSLRIEYLKMGFSYNLWK